MGIVVVHASRSLHVRVATDTMDIVYGGDLIIYTGHVCVCAFAWYIVVWYGVVGVWCSVVWIECGVD